MKRLIKNAETLGAMSDFIEQDGNTTTHGGNLTVDGNITVNSADNIIDPDGNPIISGGGGSVYMHTIKLTTGFSALWLSIFNTSETAFTVSSLFEKLTIDREVAANGYIYVSGTYYACSYFRKNSSTQIRVYYFKGGTSNIDFTDYNLSNLSITDNVIAL